MIGTGLAVHDDRTLDASECWSLIGRVRSGRLVRGALSQAEAVVVDPASGCLVLEGPRLGDLGLRTTAVFETGAQDPTGGWSVIVVGRAEPLVIRAGRDGPLQRWRFDVQELSGVVFTSDALRADRADAVRT